MEVSLPLGAAVDHEHPPTPPTQPKYELIRQIVEIGILVIAWVAVLFIFPPAFGIAGLVVGGQVLRCYRRWRENARASEDNGIAIQKEPTAQPKKASNAHPPPIDNEIAIQMEPTAQSNIASNAQLSPGSLNPLLSIAPGPMTFTYEELVTATNGFSTANFLGQGGFGDVHKGVLPSGKQVAVKRLKAGSMQGEREFQAEVEIISCIHHKHLVSLVGYCISGTQMMLVYEYVPNNTLTFHLHRKERPTMSWETRMKIALGSAKGLAYLHENCQPRIIHRDIKADNILLDYNFMAKIADFGLAKVFPDGHTHVSTQVKGTFGYLDPEYYRTRKLTDKSDVFSFGVVLLELITGRRHIYKTQSSESHEGLVYWARPFLEQALVTGTFDTLVDPRLQDYSSSEMARMVHCAAACVRDSECHRPRMNQILRALEGNIPLDDLNEGITPRQSEIYNQDGSSNYMTPASTLSSDLNCNSTGLQSQELGPSEIATSTAGPPESLV